MQDELVEVALTSLDHFTPPHLAIETKLLGASMEFTHDGRRVVIQLPTESDVVETETGRRREATLCGWHNEDGRKVPKEYQVHGVDVTIATGMTMLLPRLVVEGKSNAFDVVSEKQRAELTALASQAATWAASAVDWWLR